MYGISQCFGGAESPGRTLVSTVWELTIQRISALAADDAGNVAGSGAQGKTSLETCAARPSHASTTGGMTVDTVVGSHAITLVMWVLS